MGGKVVRYPVHKSIAEPEMGNAVTNARDYFEIVFDNWDEYYPFLNNLSDEKKT